MQRLLRIAALIFICGGVEDSMGQWQPADGPLMTRWAKEVSPANVHAEYPRPQMAREAWQNLNGLWDYAVGPANGSEPDRLDGQILVPFPIESALSGVMKPVGKDNRLWYWRKFSLNEPLGDRRLLLHFGAVDWHTVVWVNGERVGEHKGGYDPFTFDITGALQDGAFQHITLSVWDPTNEGFQPRGKQVSEPKGIWYTAVTGIWRTVWLEPVPAASIARLKITPDVDAGVVRVSVQGRGANEDAEIVAEALDGGATIASARGGIDAELELKIDNAKLWAPDHPFLYDLKVSLVQEGNAVDSVSSYFGMRKISVAKDDRGFNRLFLNNQPLFQLGTLDQGWWPDGLYTAPTDEALRYDIEVTRRLGFNMARKHVKVEPDRWYYHCDRLGLLVWQDMPSGDRYIKRDEPDMVRTPESAENYRNEFRGVIESLSNHPCIVTWVPFNEGWGQFETDAVLEWVKELDPTRLVDGPSGWADRGSGDIYDRHKYPGPLLPELDPNRATVLGEFGGLGLPIEDHLWWNKRNWGYRTYKTREELEKNYLDLIEKLTPMIEAGLAAAIYTQTTDVEGEVNGLMTYDRAVIKHDVEKLARINGALYSH